MRMLLLTPLLIFGACKDGEPEDTDTGNPNGPPPPPPQVQCDAYEYRGATYNCDNVDRCDNSAENLTYRLACCECDPQFCNPDPNCPVDPELPPLPPPPPEPPQGHSSCMTCHNGAQAGQPKWSGNLLSNPHPFGAAAYLDCVECHGGNGAGVGKDGSHVPTPPEIGNETRLQTDAVAYFNYLTMTGVDKYPSYTVNGTTYEALDWIQFRNPGDTRVTNVGRGCGSTGCHGDEHAAWFAYSPINTEVGFYSATMYTSGAENAMGYNYYWDTAADYSFRPVSDPTWTYTPSEVGRVGGLLEYPEYGQYGQNGGQYIYQNPDYNAAALDNDVHNGTIEAANRLFSGSNLEKLVQEVVTLNCGDCHAGSMGANNRYGDFRSSGCSSCHMQYALDGRTNSSDPNVPRLEPANPDAIAAPERPHIDAHQIRNVAKFIQGGFIRGINDYACAGCHQGSNRTVLQFWGIRLDQNQDVVNNFQYPANPVTFQNTANWEQNGYRLYDPAVGNVTFNGRIADQYLAFEDYDGDNRDDTPPDIHFEKGMGCIDCHGSHDMHSGTKDGPILGVRSHQSQVVGQTCESCHGDIEDYPQTVPCVDYNGQSAECATDRLGNPLRNITRDPQGYFWLRGRVDGQIHFVPLTKDIVDQASNRTHPLTGQLLFSPLASYAMGRIDNDAGNGVGPLQADPNLYDQGFAHTDKVGCVACHSSWTNNCVGCHLAPEYNADPANFFFSNTTGQRITLNFAADFVYQSPVMFQIGVGPRDRITQFQPGMKMFFRYTDLNGDTSNVFAFTDRNENGNNPNVGGRGAFGSLAHNKIMPHSTRGKVDNSNEGPRYCNSCHLNVDMDFNTYAAFKDAYLNGDYANLDFNLLQAVIGQGTNNANNDAIWVHMVSGQGSGLFAFDANGCPVNPLDANANRQFCQNQAPADTFADQVNNIVYDLDKLVEPTGVSNGSSGHPLLNGGQSLNRIGARAPGIAGPLGIDLLERLTNENVGLILDSYIDSNGAAQGNAANYIPAP
ncbi:MAG: hypothetical protein H6737_18365 [Alphaproteobacteria bacterium]|nr:hypothetical protein [Alphaproteobacteria bacterium]